MTRIKKRRTGKKRTTDRKKASAGRRGARAAKKETILQAKKPAGGAANEAVQGKPPASPVKQTGKTRSAGARRVAVSRSVASTISNKKAGAKPPPAEKKTGSKKPGKGFAPWNKNKFNSKKKEE